MIDVWITQLNSLISYDEKGMPDSVIGQDIDDWLPYIRCDYDEIDREHYTETNGGG